MRPLPAALQLELARDIDELSPADWDAVCPAEAIQSTHRFARLCQRAAVGGARFWHALLRAGGRPCAVASFSALRVRVELLAEDDGLRSVVRAVRAVWPRFLDVPVLLCGLPLSFGQPALVLAPDLDARLLCERIAWTMDGLAREAGAALLCLKEFGTADADRLAPLAQAGYQRLPSLPACALPLRWHRFDDYLASMTAGYRRQARATLRAREAAGLTARVVHRFAPLGATLERLYLSVMRRARYRMETLDRAFIEGLDRELGGAARALLLEREGAIHAAAILLRAGSTTTFLLAGLDEAADPRWQLYPNLVLEVVAEAIRDGATRLELGQTSLALKSRLGAVESPRWIYLRARSRWAQVALRRWSGALFPPRAFPARRVFRAEAPV